MLVDKVIQGVLKSLLIVGSLSIFLFAVLVLTGTIV